MNAVTGYTSQEKQVPLPHKNCLSEVQIGEEIYQYHLESKGFINTTGDLLYANGKKVTAVFPWGDKEFLVHVKGRLFHIPYTLSQEGIVSSSFPIWQKSIQTRIQEMTQGILNKQIQPHASE